MWPSFLLIFACLTVSDIVGQCAYVRTILIVNLPAEQEGMDQFMREKKMNKWNNIIMRSHHRIYTDKSLYMGCLLIQMVL